VVKYIKKQEKDGLVIRTFMTSRAGKHYSEGGLYGKSEPIF